nr:MAG: hypothetical protein DIU80_11975 [Chloroflexota bacterium]
MGPQNGRSIAVSENIAEGPGKRQIFNHQTLWLIFKIVLALGLAALVFAQVTLDDMYQLLRRISPLWLAGYAFFTYATLVCSATRYRVLIGRRISLRQALNLVVIQVVIGNLVATAAGMVSYVTLLRTRYQVQVSQSIVSVIVSRLGDLLVAFVFLAVSSWLNWPEVAGIGWLIGLLLACILAILLASTLTLLFRRRMVDFVRWVLSLLHIARLAPFQRGLRMLEELAAQDVRQMLPLALPVLVTSTLIMVCGVLSSYCGVQLFAIPIGLRQIVFMVVLVQLLSIVPIQVFGGLGVLDVTSMFIYGLFGIGADVITPILVGNRIVFYGMNLLLLAYLGLDVLLDRRGS